MWGVLELLCTDLTSAKAQMKESEAGSPFPPLPAHSLVPGIDKGSREKCESGLVTLGAEEGSREPRAGTSVLPQLSAPWPVPAGSAGAAVPHRAPLRWFPVLYGARSPSAGPASPEQRCGAAPARTGQEGAGKKLRAVRAQVPRRGPASPFSAFPERSFHLFPRRGLLPERKTRPAASPSGLLSQ